MCAILTLMPPGATLDASDVFDPRTDPQLDARRRARYARGKFAAAQDQVSIFSYSLSLQVLEGL